MTTHDPETGAVLSADPDEQCPGCGADTYAAGLCWRCRDYPALQACDLCGGPLDTAENAATERMWARRFEGRWPKRGYPAELYVASGRVHPECYDAHVLEVAS